MANLTIDYKKTSSSDSAYEAVKKHLMENGLGGFEDNVNLEYNDKKKLIHAEGKGFELNAVFAETCLEIDLDLAFLLRPFQGKILQGLGDELKKVI